ncbi:putative mannose 6-phosphate receptor-like protein [Fonsecaea pedrosoi]|nr:putative mannose 6-phosphate receptor-like protein [Fonsecaea pedrosoi]
MYLSTSFFLVLLSSLPSSLAATDAKPPPKPCTIHSASTGSFFDLHPLQLTLEGTKYQVASNESYHSKGYDYPANFTMNFCGPVVEQLEDVEGIPTSKLKNISAFYRDAHGDIYSIGQQNDQLLFRGKKLILNYTMGSPCPDLDEDGTPIEGLVADKVNNRRKSTLLSFICDTSPLLSTRPAVSFLGSPDHCTYVFEVRSRWACGGTTQSGEKGTLGPGAVFGLIAGIALLVYLIGGIVYQRNVLHQRGWRQLPNYAMWAGIFGFFSRMPGGVTQLFAGRRGYHRVGTDDRHGRGRTPDDENRLIDQLDEEWDD